MTDKQVNKTTEVFESKNSNYSSTEVERALKLAEKTLRDIIRVYKFETGTPVTALAAIREALAEPVKQEPVAFKFPREPKPENAMGWTVDYELIRDIAEAIGDQEFHPGYEGIELTLIALERIYAAPVSAEREWVELTDDEIVSEFNKSRNNFDYASAVIAAFKEKNT